LSLCPNARRKYQWLVYAFEKNPNTCFGRTRKLLCNVHYHPLSNKPGYCLVLLRHVWSGVVVEDDTEFGQPLFPSTSLAVKNQLRERNKQVLQRENLGRKRRRVWGSFVTSVFQKFHIPLILPSKKQMNGDKTTSRIVTYAAMGKSYKHKSFNSNTCSAQNRIAKTLHKSEPTLMHSEILSASFEISFGVFLGF
jgi:hypothetical protein